MEQPLLNQFIYRPDATGSPPGFTPTALGLAYEEVALETADGLTLSGWYLPAQDAEPFAALLYCHGNAGDIRDWVHAAPPFVEAGVSVLVWDYRGYGRSEGEPSEDGLYRDGEAAWQWFQERAASDGLPAMLLGKSLGSAVAVHIAATSAGTGAGPAGLILDSAFTSMREVIGNVVSLPLHLIPSLYESLERVSAITAPTLVVHGGRDQLVPVSQGRRLYEALTAPKAWRVAAQAGHNDLVAYPEYHRWLLAFLRDPAGFTA
jgi:fermentation-respiration switch protein FrsA (DUF1100 family)